MEFKQANKIEANAYERLGAVDSARALAFVAAIHGELQPQSGLHLDMKEHAKARTIWLQKNAAAQRTFDSEGVSRPAGEPPGRFLCVRTGGARGGRGSGEGEIRTPE